MEYRSIELSSMEWALIGCGHYVMRGNGRFTHELWYTTEDNPDKWNLWRLAAEDKTRSDKDRGKPQWTGESCQVWWWGSYLTQCEMSFSAV